jgi:hypothetical protein
VSTRTSIPALAAVAAVAAAALAATGASAKPVMGVIIKPPVLGVPVKPPIFGVVIHHPDHDDDQPHYWWHHNHYPLVIVGSAPTAASTPVATAPCTCLTKNYLTDGSVLFKDVCTKEAAVASPDELKAQMQGARP